MNLLLTGASGVIGARCGRDLERLGHSVWRAVRRATRGPGEVAWDPGSGRLDPIQPFDAVIHLAGHSLAAGRWTAAQKRRAWSSRVDATRALCERLVSQAPRVLLCASAVGIYGDRADQLLDEASAPGNGFLADLARAWEEASLALERAGTRVVRLRIGLVLAREGGALPPLARATRLGLGGPLGSGRQFWSWVAIDDVAGAFLHALDHESLAGPVNVVGPEPVRQADFARVLGRCLRRPAILPAPAFALRLLLGEMADEALLSSARVAPSRLSSSGYRFRRADLESALRAALQPEG